MTMARTVFITGGSSGFGQATARLFAARGWNVVATMRKLTHRPDWASASQVLILPVDVTDEATIRAAVSVTLERFGAIDVLINSAGCGLFGPLEGASAERLEAQFRTNVFGLAAMIRHVLPSMRTARRGTIVNISSMAGRFGAPFMSAYHASKFAVEGLSESLRFELKPHGIRVKLVEPGFFKTDFFARSLQWTEHEAYEPQYGRMRRFIMRTASHGSDPDDMAQVIFAAATDDSGRLRYPVKWTLVRGLHALVPDALWRWGLDKALSREPGHGPAWRP